MQAIGCGSSLAHGPNEASAGVAGVTDLPDVHRSPDGRTALTEMLDYHRTVLLRKAEGLSDAQLAIRFEPSTPTLGGLLMHVALVEDGWLQATSWAATSEGPGTISIGNRIPIVSSITPGDSLAT